MGKGIIRIKNWLKWSDYESLWGLLIGLIVSIILYIFIKNIWISIIGFIIISFISMIVIQMKGIDDYAKQYIEVHKKDQYIKPEDIRGKVSENLDNLLDLDKELSDFFNKYSPVKKDYYAKELNKQWKIHGDDFVKRAKDILSKMNNQELLYSLLSTKEIINIVDIFDYFTPFVMDFDYLKEHPEKAKEYYYENLMQIKAIGDNSVNEYYFNRLMNLNYFDEIEKTILSYMSNEELMELADSSKDWQEKLYFYGFIKK